MFSSRILKLFIIFTILCYSLFGITNASLSDTENSKSNSFTASCWGAPSDPSRLSPSDNSTTTDIHFSWTTATNHCPDSQISYKFEIFTDSHLTNPYYQSGWIGNEFIDLSAIPEGNYWWRVISKDEYNYSNLFPPVWNLTVGLVTRPTSEITSDESTYRQSDFEIDYTTSSDTTDIGLCYSHNTGIFICLPKVSVGSHFDFNSPQGDGVYEFYTIAYNGSLAEDKDESGANYRVQVDTKPPTTGFSFINRSPGFNGQNLIKSDWQIDGKGDHHLTDTGFDILGNGFTSPTNSTMYEIGFRSASPDHAATDAVYQPVSIPSHLSTTISFLFRVLTEDIVDYDQFSVNVLDKNGSLLENILTTGSDELGGSEYTSDSGWRSFTRSLTAYAGQVVRLWFGVTNGGTDPSYRTWAYLDDLKLTTLDTRLGDTEPPLVETHDTGSGINTVPTPTLIVGENNLEVGITDIAGNVEATKSASIIVNPIVINKFSFVGSNEWAELYNNSSNPVDVNRYCLDGNQAPLIIEPDKVLTHTTIIQPYSSIRIIKGIQDYFALDDFGGTFYLRDNNYQIVDQTVYIGSIVSGAIWQRTPDGLGTWSLSLPVLEPKVLDFNLVSRKEVNKVTFTIFNIPDNFGQNSTDRISYDIIYSSGSDQKGIGGDISFNSIFGNKTDRDFYLGTCSTGGNCRADSGIGSTISVTLTGNLSGVEINPPLTKTFSY